MWEGGGRGEPELLASCYRNCLEIAAAENLATIAFPAISTGVYGYPKDAAARAAYPVIEDFLVSHDMPRAIYLVFFSQSDADIFVRFSTAP